MKDDRDKDNSEKFGMQPASSVPLPKMRKGLKGFYRDVLREMKHVHWPTRHETNRLTGVVLAICALTVLILTALSQVFQVVFDIILRGK